MTSGIPVSCFHGNTGISEWVSSVGRGSEEYEDDEEEEEEEEVTSADCVVTSKASVCLQLITRL